MCPRFSCDVCSGKNTDIVFARGPEYFITLSLPLELRAPGLMSSYASCSRPDQVSECYLIVAHNTTCRLDSAKNCLSEMGACLLTNEVSSLCAGYKRLHVDLHTLHCC
jgi:hypothetical protein